MTDTSGLDTSGLDTSGLDPSGLDLSATPGSTTSATEADSGNSSDGDSRPHSDEESDEEGAVTSPPGQDGETIGAAAPHTVEPVPVPGEAAPRPERAPRTALADPSQLERESEIAADYLEELLDIADLDGDIDMDIERDRAAVSIVGGELAHLVGPEGSVLDALQELTRLAVHTATGNRSRLMLDVGGYRAGRRAVLSELGRQTAEAVRSSGDSIRLNAMTPFERKIVHDAVAAAGLKSASEGEEPHRRVVVLPG